MDGALKPTLLGIAGLVGNPPMGAGNGVVVGIAEPSFPADGRFKLEGARDAGFGNGGKGLGGAMFGFGWIGLPWLGGVSKRGEFLLSLPVVAGLTACCPDA